MPIRTQAERKLDFTKAKIQARHGFDFKLEGVRCRYVYKQDTGFKITEVPGWLESDLESLCDEIRRFEERTKLLLLKERDVQTFLYKLFRSKAQMSKALRNVRVSVSLADWQ